MALLPPKGPFWVFPCACWNPYFCSVWWLWMGTKKDHFPKTDSCNENTRFLLPSEHGWCLPIFLKNAILTRRPFFFMTIPGALFLFVCCPFRFFCFLSVALSDIKTTKAKNACFVQRPFFYTPTTCQKIFSHPYTPFVILNYPKNTMKLGEKQANINLGQIFDSTLARFLTQKMPNLGQLLTLQHIYIYI